MNEQEVFVAALKIPAGAERNAYVEQACKGDSAFKQMVCSLLEAHERADHFLESGDEPFIAQTKLSDPISEGPGSVIGPYRILQQIGEGGFGVVFMAEQTEPVRRRVALKVIKPGMDTRQVIARFEAERQALAMMDHPHIAKVYDAGMTATGLPYFVMELVKGIPITQFCDDHQLTLRERLELFVTVCQAAQHAHQKGIIHRDIKPSNVLVTLHDDRPVVKVIDFGVAKATSGQLTDKTLFTGFMQMLGTPLYMSPEQTALSGVDVDTRSDIYSLGVLLYELLTGSTPFDRERLNQAALDEVRRIIREEEPKKPSTRVSTQGDSLPSIAVHRRIEPKKLGQLLRGDLDWIVMKALEKDRTRRYETANGFARDVQRYLADELVEARPPSSAYRLRKAIRRNKVALTTAGLVSLALILGTTISVWQAVRATKAEARVTALLDDVSQALEDETEARQEAQKNLDRARTAVDEFFTQVSQNTLFDMPNLQPLRKELLEGAVRYYESMLGQYPDDPDLLADFAIARLRIAPIYYGYDRLEDTVDEMEASLESIQKLRREFPDAKEAHLRLAGFWRPLRGGSKAERTVDEKRTTGIFKAFVEVYESLSRDFPQSVSFQNDLAAAYHAYSSWQMETGHLRKDTIALQQGFDASDKGIAIWERLYREHPDQPDYAENLIEILENRRYWCRATGRGEQGQSFAKRRRKVLDECVQRFPNAPEILVMSVKSVLDEAKQLERERNFVEAESKFQQALKLTRRLRENYPAVPGFATLMCKAHLGVCSVAPHIGLKKEEVEKIKLGIAADIAKMQNISREYFRAPADRQAYANALEGIGWTAKKSGEREIAVKAFQLSYKTFKELAEEFPQQPKYRIRAASIARGMAFSTGGEARCDFLREAVRILHQLHTDYPEDAEYSHLLLRTQAQLSGSLLKAGRLKECRETVDKWMAFDQQHPELTANDKDATKYKELSGVIAWEGNQLAWRFVADQKMSEREWQYAVRLARRAVELAPQSRATQNTLGVAEFRVGNLDAAEAALQRSMNLNLGGNPWDWFFLAMVDWQQGERERARHWFDAACLWAAKYQPDNKELIRFRTEAQTLLGITDPEIPDEIDDAMISRALFAADPDLVSFRLFKGRAESHVRNYEWTAAKADAMRAAEMKLDDEWLHFQVAALLACAGDEPAYRKHCRRMLKKRADTTIPEFAERTAKACLLLPAGGDDLEAAARLAERAVNHNPKHWVIPFAQLANALVAYRRGNFSKAVEWCDQVMANSNGRVWFRDSETLLVRALARAGLDDYEAAQADYDKADAILKKEKSAADARPVVHGNWADFAICEALQREYAEKVALANFSQSEEQTAESTEQ